MKTLKIIFIALLLISVNVVSAANLKIKVKAYKKIPEQEYAVCIKRYDWNFGYGFQYDTIYFSKDGKFDIQLNKGRYILALLHPSSDNLYYHLYIPEKNSVIDLSVELDRKTLPEKIERVQLTGDFNNYDYATAIEMEYNAKGKFWQIPVEKRNQKIGSYFFIVNNNDRIHNPESPTGKLNTWANYANTKDKTIKDIILRPSKFKQGKPAPKITGQGVDTVYHFLCENMKDIFEVLDSKRSTLNDISDLQNYTSVYNQQKDKFQKLVEKYDDKFNWVLFEGKFSLINLSPKLAEMILMSKNKQRSIANSKKQTDMHYEMTKEKANLFRNFNRNELALTSRLLREINNMYYEVEFSDLNEELDIPYGYFRQMLADILKASEDDEIKGEILSMKAHLHSNSRPEKSLRILNMIKLNYPDYSGVKNGSIDKEIFAINLREGAKAPEFKLKTLEGKDISLEGFKGKYVFLDFWGTWCGPCVYEIPNVKRLSEEIPDNKLVVIGIACNDKEEKVRKFIEENKVKYLNAMSVDGIETKYGVNSYPTTFLIDKEGVIKAKNLRGSEIIEMIKNEVKE